MHPASSPFRGYRHLPQKFMTSHCAAGLLSRSAARTLPQHTPTRCSKYIDTMWCRLLVTQCSWRAVALHSQHGLGGLFKGMEGYGLPKPRLLHRDGSVLVPGCMAVQPWPTEEGGGRFLPVHCLRCACASVGAHGRVHRKGTQAKRTMPSISCLPARAPGRAVCLPKCVL